MKRRRDSRLSEFSGSFGLEILIQMVFLNCESDDGRPSIMRRTQKPIYMGIHWNGYRLQGRTRSSPYGSVGLFYFRQRGSQHGKKKGSLTNYLLEKMGSTGLSKRSIDLWSNICEGAEMRRVKQQKG